MWNNHKKEVHIMDKLTIKECYEEVLEIMHSKNYSESTLKSYEGMFTDFFIYCQNKGISYFDEVLAIKYANELTGLELKDLAQDNKPTGKYIILLRALRILSNYSTNRIFMPKFSRFHDDVTDEYYKPIYDSYSNYLKNDCDYKKATLNRKDFVLRKLIEILVREDAETLNDISKSVIEKIISTFIHETPKSVTNNLGDIKQFFKFCYENNLCDKDLVQLVPEIKTPHETKISVNFSQEEVKKILDSIDKNDPLGKRDYAIISLASHLGLRAIDIINLKFQDLNWENKTLTIKQEKTAINVTLPLLNDVGWSLIDYIKSARPKINSDYIFLRHKSPYEPFNSTSAMTNIFTRRIHNAGIKIPRDCRYGIHSLRHTLGTLLLEKETSLITIAQILGHQSIHSTETYIKVNMKGLEECPIDPERVFDK